MPGQPVERHGDALIVERLAHHADHLGARGEIAVRVQHALRQAGRAGGEKDLGRRIGIDMRAPLRHRRIDRARRQRAERQAAFSIDGDDARTTSRRAIERRSIDLRILREDERGLHHRQRMIEARQVARGRIARRYRRQQRPGPQRAEQEQRILEAVVGENGERFARRAVALRDQPRGDGAGLRPGFGIGKALPGALRPAPLGKPGHLRPPFGGAAQQIDHQRQVLGQGARRGEDQRAVAAPLDRHLGLGPVERPHRRETHGPKTPNRKT